MSERVTRKDVVVAIIGAVVGTVVPGIIGWYTGSFDVVLSFANIHPGESVLWTLLFLFTGMLIGLLVRGRSARKQIREKDDEISRLSGVEAELEKSKARVIELEAKVAELSKTEHVRTPSGKLCCNMTAVRQLPTETIEAMLDAYDHGGGTKLGTHEKWVRKSINDKDGIFRIGRKYFMGYPGDETDDYFLTKNWMEFMDDPKALTQVRDIVRSAGPIWHEL